MRIQRNILAAALVAATWSAPAFGSLVYSESFSGAAGTQPAADPIWRTNVVLGGGDTAVTQNDGAGEYEQVFSAGTAGDIRTLGYYNNPDDTDRGVWRDTDISALMEFTGGALNLTGLAFRATDNATAVGAGSYYHVRVNGSTLELLRNNNGTFTTIGSAAGGAFAGSTQRLVTVSVDNVAQPDVDDVHIVATLYNGTTVGSGVLRTINVTDTTTSAITIAGGVGFRTAFQGGSPTQRSGYDDLTVNTRNPSLLWYDDYYNNAAVRTQAFSSGGAGQSVSSGKYNISSLDNDGQGRATIDFDSHTSTWEHVQATAMMRWNTNASGGRLEGGVFVRETGMTSTTTGDYYFFTLVRNEDSGQSAARIYRVINNALGTEVAGGFISNAFTAESTNLFLSLKAVTNALGFVELTAIGSLNADFSSPFTTLAFTDTAANRILGAGSAGFRVGGSGAMTVGQVNFDNFTVVSIPAPAALPAGLALGSLVAMGRRRRRPSHAGCTKPWRLERHARPPGLVAVVAMMLTGASAARAAYVSEYFDNYGTTVQTTLEAEAGGVGWLSDWRDSTVGTFESDRVGYEAVNNSFVNANYVGGGEAGSDDGRARIETTDSSAGILRRSFATGLTGTVWMSAIMRHENNTAGDILFWFETTASGFDANTFIGLRTGDTPTLRHGGENTSAADIGQSSTNLLLLARIELDFSGTFDRVSFWVKNEAADLSSIAALGAPLLSEGDENLFGSELNFIGLSGGGANGNIDNLRYADGANAFGFILGGAAAVPAPAALPAGLAMGSLVAMRRRRRRG